MLRPLFWTRPAAYFPDATGLEKRRISAVKLPTMIRILAANPKFHRTSTRPVGRLKPSKYVRRRNERPSFETGLLFRKVLYSSVAASET